MSTKAVKEQTRNPGAKRYTPPPGKHMVVVEMDGGSRAPDYVSPYDELMGMMSPLRDGVEMYEDIGFQPGVCSSKNQRVLLCDVEDSDALQTAAARESHSKAFSKAPVGRVASGEVRPIEVNAPQRALSIEHLQGSRIEREADPETRY